MCGISRSFKLLIVISFITIISSFILFITTQDAYAEVTNCEVNNPVVEDKDGITYGYDTIKSTWDCIYFGSYYQDDSSTKEPIKWRVLSVDENDAFLISDRILNRQPFNATAVATSWKNCTLREWFNNDFYNDAFDAEEKSAILDTTVVTTGSEDTVDKIFTLSIDELKMPIYGFPSSGYTFSRSAVLTDYARSLGTQEFKDHNDNNYYGSWWTRTTPEETYFGSGEYEGDGFSGTTIGGTYIYAEPIQKSTIGIRPALHIDLSSNNWKNAGTVMMNGKTELAPNMCGDHLYWELLNNGTLAITGHGDMTGCPWSSQAAQITSVEFPEGMTSVCKNAFKGCTSLTEVSFPSSLKTIGEGAFSDSWITGKLTIPEGIATIEKNAFAGCELITGINLPSTLQSIGESAFMNCTGLKSSLVINNPTLSIGNYAFQGCKNIQEISLDVASIGKRSFESVTKVTKVVLSDNLSSIGDWAFKGCTNITELQCSNNTPWEFSRSSKSAFNDCIAIEKITVTGNGSYNGATVFWNANTFVETPLSSCKGNIKAVILEGDISEIRSFAFDGCSELKTVEMTNSITSIGAYGFRGCSSLADFVFPNSVTLISEGCFKDCTSLSNIELPDSIIEIGENAFNGCTAITKFSMPANVSKIDASAFKDCKGIQSIFIPRTVLKIDDNAFNGCANLSCAVFCGDAPINFGSNVFSSCAGDFSIVYPSDATGWSEQTWEGYPAYASDNIDPSGHIWNKEYSIDEEATCTKEGSESIHCSLCGVIDESTVKTIPAIGHEWNEPSYTWSRDYSSVTATRTCKHDSSHRETETIATTSEVTKAATYTVKGQTTYAAEFTNPVFTKQYKAVSNIDKLAKKANTLTAKGKTVTIKYTKVKKKTQTITKAKAFAISNAKGTVTFKKISGNKKITIAKSGKITVKKGLKKGTYKLKVKVTAAGTTVYKPLTKQFKATIKIK